MREQSWDTTTLTSPRLPCPRSWDTCPCPPPRLSSCHHHSHSQDTDLTHNTVLENRKLPRFVHWLNFLTESFNNTLSWPCCILTSWLQWDSSDHVVVSLVSDAAHCGEGLEVPGSGQLKLIGQECSSRFWLVNAIFTWGTISSGWIVSLIFLCLEARYRSRHLSNLSLMNWSQAGTFLSDEYFWGMNGSFLLPPSAVAFSQFFFSFSLNKYSVNQSEISNVVCQPIRDQ